MALDSKLRLQIVTALDNAGIKATEDQINGLATKIQDINKEAVGKKLENAFGDLPGKIGKITKALGGLPGTLSLVVGAFQFGWEIGTKFFDTVIKGWFGWEDAVTKLKKSNAAMMKSLKASAQDYEQMMTRVANQYDIQQAKIDTTIEKINTLTQSYTRLGKAQSDFDNAGADQDIQQLERERFEDMLALQASGEYDAAEQVNKVYHILRQELEAKKEIAKYDEESARLQAERVAKEQEAFKLVDKVNSWQKQRDFLKEKLDTLDANPAAYTARRYDQMRDQLVSQIAKIDNNLQKAENKAIKYNAELDAAEYDELSRQRNRSTLVDRLNLDRDKLLWQAGQAIDADYNRYGWNFSDDFIKQSYDSSMKSYTELKDIKKNTENLAEKLDELLGLKQ